MDELHQKQPCHATPISQFLPPDRSVRVADRHFRDGTCVVLALRLCDGHGASWLRGTFQAVREGGEGSGKLRARRGRALRAESKISVAAVLYTDERTGRGKSR